MVAVKEYFASASEFLHTFTSIVDKIEVYQANTYF